MSLKNSLLKIMQQELAIPLAGIAPLDDYSQHEMDGISALINYFSKQTTVPDDMKTPRHLREMLEGMKSVVVTAVPVYMKKPFTFDQCRERLLGSGSPLHLSDAMRERDRERVMNVYSFFTDRGFACKPVSASLVFPLKIMAFRCGIGFYGKNSMILNPEHGSWLRLAAYMTDAPLEPDTSVPGDCGTCDACVRACPAGALAQPYRCDESLCINFHLGHNKQQIPRHLRPACGNLVGQACTVCRDVCPKNKNVKPVKGCDPPLALVHPPLLDIVAIDDETWKKTFGRTLMGLTMQKKRYLQRNAAIGLGNFRDERAVEALAEQLMNGTEEVRGCAAWALGRIASPGAVVKLQEALGREENQDIREEIIVALESAGAPPAA